MRHGYEWWEAFWKWFLNESKDHGGIFNIDVYLKNMKKEFEELWREGKIILPPKER